MFGGSQIELSLWPLWFNHQVFPQKINLVHSHQCTRVLVIKLEMGNGITPEFSKWCIFCYLTSKIHRCFAVIFGDISSLGAGEAISEPPNTAEDHRHWWGGRSIGGVVEALVGCRSNRSPKLQGEW